MNEVIIILLEFIIGLLIFALAIGGVPLLMLFLKKRLRLKWVTAPRALGYSLLSLGVLIFLSASQPSSSGVKLSDWQKAMQLLLLIFWATPYVALLVLFLASKMRPGKDRPPFVSTQTMKNRRRSDLQPPLT